MSLLDRVAGQRARAGTGPAQGPARIGASSKSVRELIKSHELYSRPDPPAAMIQRDLVTTASPLARQLLCRASVEVVIRLMPTRRSRGDYRRRMPSE
jgi:hypothetical protein